MSSKTDNREIALSWQTLQEEFQSFNCALHSRPLHGAATINNKDVQHLIVLDILLFLRLFTVTILERNIGRNFFQSSDWWEHDSNLSLVSLFFRSLDKAPCDDGIARFEEYFEVFRNFTAFYQNFVFTFVQPFEFMVFWGANVTNFWFSVDSNFIAWINCEFLNSFLFIKRCWYTLMQMFCVVWNEGAWENIHKWASAKLNLLDSLQLQQTTCSRQQISELQDHFLLELLTCANKSQRSLWDFVVILLLGFFLLHNLWLNRLIINCDTDLLDNYFLSNWKLKCAFHGIIFISVLVFNFITDSAEGLVKITFHFQLLHRN